MFPGGLENVGFEVDIAASLADALEAIAAGSYAAILLDHGLPDGDGGAVLRRLRERGDPTPVLVLTARGTVQDRVSGLHDGADDYLVKPFALEELVARIHALLRRPGDFLGRLRRAGNVAFDAVARQVYVNDQPQILSARETALLELLIGRVGRVVTKTYAEANLFGQSEELRSNAIEVYVHRLRQAARRFRRQCRDTYSARRGISSYRDPAMMPRAGSILSRIIWLHAVALTAVAIAVPLATYLLLETTANGFENQTLRAHAETLANYLNREPGGNFSLDLPRDLRTFYLHGFDGFAYSIVDNSNRVLFTSVRGGGQLPGGKEAGDAPSYFQHSLGKAIYYGASFPVTRSGQMVRVQVGQDLEHPDVIIDDIVAGYLARVAWFTIPILLLPAGNRYSDRSPRAQACYACFRHGARDRSGPHRSCSPAADVPAEVRPLVLAVNQALDRLEQGFRAQREFTADAAHELRTPLAVLRARIDTLSDGDTASALRADLENMTHVVNQLLAVAELEANTAGAMETVDLHGICSEVAASLAPIAIAQKKDIALVGAEAPVPVRGNAPMLHRAIRNLAENALRHTPEGTSVEIGVSRDGVVSVSDEGPGVPASERELIFRRFWRRDRSRADGAGLGLAIVSRIVEAHAGQIEVSNRGGRAARSSRSGYGGIVILSAARQTLGRNYPMLSH